MRVGEDRLSGVKVNAGMDGKEAFRSRNRMSVLITSKLV